MKITLTRQSISNNNVTTVAIDSAGKLARNGNEQYFAEVRCAAPWQSGARIVATSDRGETKEIEVTQVERPVTGDVILTLAAK